MTFRQLLSESVSIALYPALGVRIDAPSHQFPRRITACELGLVFAEWGQVRQAVSQRDRQKSGCTPYKPVLWRNALYRVIKMPYA